MERGKENQRVKLREKKDAPKGQFLSSLVLQHRCYSRAMISPAARLYNEAVFLGISNFFYTITFSNYTRSKLAALGQPLIYSHI